VLSYVFFFFFKQKTAYEISDCDWSSDVCSSDLPVVRGDGAAKRLSLVYAVLTAAVSVVPFFTGAAGPVYLAAATVLGIGLIAIAALDLRGKRWTRRLWTYSLVYVALLFTVFALSPFVA